jgi:hypothetical protein
MANRTPTEGDVTAQRGHSAFTRPICGELEHRGDQSFVCVKDPDHDGAHTPTAVTTDAVRRLAARYGRPAPDAPTEVLGTDSPPPGADTEDATADPTPDHGPGDGPQPITPPAPTELSAVEAGAGEVTGSGRPVVTVTADGPLTEQQATGIKTALEGRPQPGRSIGVVIANSAIDAALGVPVELQDERAHAREATVILLEAAADHHRHGELMPMARLLDLQAVVQHMVEARS